MGPGFLFGTSASTQKVALEKVPWNLKVVTIETKSLKGKSAYSSFMINKVSNSEVVSHGDRTLLPLINFSSGVYGS